LASGIENEQGISEVCMVSYSTAHILSNALTPVTPDSEVSIGEGYIHARPGLHVEKLTILKYTVYHLLLVDTHIAIIRNLVFMRRSYV